MVQAAQPDGTSKWVISVPPIMFPGLVQAIHIKAAHPVKTQTTRLMKKHFFAPAMDRVITEVIDACDTCSRLKKLPKELFQMSTSTEDQFCKEFYADVVKANSQNVLLVREKVEKGEVDGLIVVHPRAGGGWRLRRSAHVDLLRVNLPTPLLRPPTISS